VPSNPPIDFMSLSVVFILATLLGFASHAPGSLGVFDAAMLVALPQFGREELLATLLVFRVLYFVIPFGLAISIMGVRELLLNVVLPWQERRRLGEKNEVPRDATPMPQRAKRIKQRA
jgi:glycosyltransferase 2 family protein